MAKKEYIESPLPKSKQYTKEESAFSESGFVSHDAELAERDRWPLRKVYGRLLFFVRPYWKVLIVALCGTALFSIGVVLIADMMQFVLDTLGDRLKRGEGVMSTLMLTLYGDALANDRASLAFIIPALMVFLVCVRALGTVLSSYGFNYVSSAMSHDLRCLLFDRVLKLSVYELSYRGVGELLLYFGGRVGSAASVMNKTLVTLFRDGLTLAALLGYLLYLNWQLSILFFTVVPIIILVIRLTTGWIRRMTRHIQMEGTKLTQALHDTLLGFKEIQIFGTGGYELGKYKRMSRRQRRLGLRIAVVHVLLQPVLQILLAVALGLLISTALAPTTVLDFSPGQFTSYLIAAGLVSSPARGLSGVYAGLQVSAVNIQDLFVLLDGTSEEDKGHYSVTRASGRVEFRKVSFKYKDDGPDILKDISFVAEPGQMIALVGHTGSGKSTMINMILRFLLPNSGVILLDDMDAREYKLPVYRKQIGAVLQHNFLFNSSVYHNIAYGNIDKDDAAEIDSIAKATYVTEFMGTKKDALQKTLGVHGEQLSGGQEQRIAIARALYKDAPVLILDEATSSLDNRTEYQLQQALKKLSKGRTTFVIAHRLSTVEHADIILVLNKGRIVERGSHQELLEKDGEYAELYHRKFSDS